MVSKRSIGTGYRWQPGWYVRVNSRPAPEDPEAPNSALGSSEGNPYCEFQDGSSHSLSDRRLWVTVAKGIPEPQGLLGSSSGYDRYKERLQGQTEASLARVKSFLQILLSLSRISHLVMVARRSSSRILE
jgi:hypothetical protein